MGTVHSQKDVTDSASQRCLPVDRMPAEESLQTNTIVTPIIRIFTLQKTDSLREYEKIQMALSILLPIIRPELPCDLHCIVRIVQIQKTRYKSYTAAADKLFLPLHP